MYKALWDGEIFNDNISIKNILIIRNFILNKFFVSDNISFNDPLAKVITNSYNNHLHFKLFNNIIIISHNRMFDIFLAIKILY